MFSILPRFTLEPEFWLLVVPALGCAFVLGLIFRPRRPRMRSANQSVGNMLSGASDQALDLLEKNTALKPDTIRTYMTLGNLFRSRGEFERATRIHEGIAARSDVDGDVRRQAEVELGLDYNSAGLLDHAEATYQQALAQMKKDDPQLPTVLLALASLYERQQRWADAVSMRDRLEKLGDDDGTAHAYLLVRIADEELKKGNETLARKLLNEAVKRHNGCLPAWQNLLRLDIRYQAFAEACDKVEQILKTRPELFHLIETEMVEAFAQAKEKNRLNKIWHEAATHPNTHWSTATAYAQWLHDKGHDKKALTVLQTAFENNPHTIEIAHALASHLRQMGQHDEALAILDERLNLRARKFMAYQCSQCGYNSQRVFWHCPQCQKWDTIRPIAVGKK